MKKLILITIMLLSTLVCASKDSDLCRELRYRQVISAICPPLESGTYFTVDNDLKYTDGTDKKVGDDFYYLRWEDDPWYKSHWISCKITDFEFRQSHDYYLITLDCTVEERTQFFNANYTAYITYTDLKGHRSDGTLKWSRDEIGSTDIYCYDKSGMTIVKHVNDPYYCK